MFVSRNIINVVPMGRTKWNILINCCNPQLRNVQQLRAKSYRIAASVTNLTKFTEDYLHTVKRYKHDKKGKSKNDAHSDVDSDDEGSLNKFNSDSSLNRDSKVVSFNLTSSRTDLVLKAAIGMARNKIETIFYESKIRLNGKKLLKKSVQIQEGDEIDVVKGVSPNNPDHLYVTRVEVLEIRANEDSIKITVRRFKSLLIENYDEPYKKTMDT